MRRTPLHGEHLALGAKMVPFAGYEMPIQYTSIIEEHMAVRSACGIFDVSHMGNVIIRGERARGRFAGLLTNRTVEAPMGRCVYSHILNEEGMILDDTIVAPVGEDEVYMVPNAATTAKIVEWTRGQLKELEVLDLSSDLATIAVQGPAAEKVVARMTSADVSALGSFWAAFVKLDAVSEGQDATNALLAGRSVANPDSMGAHALLSRTGYTGEDGFEITCENASAVAIWRALLENGEDLGVRPIGLGARDTLRLEKGLLLSGTDFDGSQTSLQTGPSWVVKWDHEFVGRRALEKQREAGGYPVLAGIVLRDKGIPRHGYPIVSDGAEVGSVTSGTMSPVLRKGVALGYLPAELARPGTPLGVRIREATAAAEVVKTPFVRRNQI